MQSHHNKVCYIEPKTGIAKRLPAHVRGSTIKAYLKGLFPCDRVEIKTMTKEEQRVRNKK